MFIYSSQNDQTAPVASKILRRKWAVVTVIPVVTAAKRPGLGPAILSPVCWSQGCPHLCTWVFAVFLPRISSPRVHTLTPSLCQISLKGPISERPAPTSVSQISTYSPRSWCYLFPFHRWENKGSEKLRVSQIKFQLKAVPTPSPSFFLFVMFILFAIYSFPIFAQLSFFLIFNIFFYWSIVDLQKPLWSPSFFHYITHSQLACFMQVIKNWVGYMFRICICLWYLTKL